jgi:hypothetical protein
MREAASHFSTSRPTDLRYLAHVGGEAGSGWNGLAAAPGLDAE